VDLVDDIAEIPRAIRDGAEANVTRRAKDSFRIGRHTRCHNPLISHRLWEKGRVDTTTAAHSAASSRRDFKGMERVRLRAARMYEQGTSQAEVAHRLGTSRHNAHRWYRKWRHGGRLQGGRAPDGSLKDMAGPVATTWQSLWQSS
jgi:Homeodomain-like domain